MKTLRLLLTPVLQETIPATITILQNWGPTVIVVGNNFMNQRAGDHVIVQGEQNDIQNWINSNGGAFIGVGIPQMEQFDFINPLQFT